MTVHSFSSAAGAAAPLTRARVSGSLPVWSLSLGCPKNRVDTEHLLGSLGMPVHSVEHMGRARLVFINTCGFIEPAVRESIRSILDAVERLGRCKRRPLLAVAGCMVGRYGVKAERFGQVGSMPNRGWYPFAALCDEALAARRDELHDVKIRGQIMYGPLKAVECDPAGEHFTCPKCGAPSEVFSRIVGYMRPVSQWNEGKRAEFADRKLFDRSVLSSASPRCASCE